MAKRIMFFMLSFIIFGGLVACKNDTDIKIGKYVTENGLAWIELKEGKQFSFNRNIATDYDPVGTYILNKDKIILQVNGNVNEVIEFKISEGKLIFESGKLAESLIEKGTVFIFGEEHVHQRDYRPMISFGDSLYFDTGKAEEQLSKEWMKIGEIKEFCSSNKPMKTGADHYVSNMFSIGTEIYGKSQDLDVIYISYGNKFIEYILQDKEN